jgi:hypothetical protein
MAFVSRITANPPDRPEKTQRRSFPALSPRYLRTPCQTPNASLCPLATKLLLHGLVDESFDGLPLSSDMRLDSAINRTRDFQGRLHVEQVNRIFVVVKQTV